MRTMTSTIPGALALFGCLVAALLICAACE